MEIRRHGTRSRRALFLLFLWLSFVGCGVWGQGVVWAGGLWPLAKGYVLPRAESFIPSHIVVPADPAAASCVKNAARRHRCREAKAHDVIANAAAGNEQQAQALFLFVDAAMQPAGCSRAAQGCRSGHWQWVTVILHAAGNFVSPIPVAGLPGVILIGCGA